jgi:hypothetical protein
MRHLKASRVAGKGGYLDGIKFVCLEEQPNIRLGDVLVTMLDEYRKPNEVLAFRYNSCLGTPPVNINPDCEVLVLNLP